MFLNMNQKTMRLFLCLCGILSLLTACQPAVQGESLPSSGISQGISEETFQPAPSRLPSPTGEETTPELFLASRTEEELLLFVDAAWAAVGGPGMERSFASPADISSEGLLSFFFRITDEQAFYREETEAGKVSQRYYCIPLEAVTSQLDRYFDEYTFCLEDTNWAEEYDRDKQQFISRSFIGWGDSVVWKIDTVRGEEKNIFIAANQLDPTDPEKLLATGTLQLFFNNQEIRFLSFHYQPC